MNELSILALPSPSTGVWQLGPIPLRAYAACIMIGILVAIWVGNKRWIARGGQPGIVGDVAVWAVPFGLVGARVYHVVTDWEPYFGSNGDPLLALQIWRGGLGVWGAIAGGALGAWIACRRAGVPLPAFADALAPGIVLAQAIGRWGNWFNQELYGRPTDLPWGLHIDRAHRMPGYLDVEVYHPTFLYESLWCLGVAAILVLVDRRFRLGHGRVFALYVAAYTVGRAWIEELRIDPAHEVFGMRLNFWTAVVVCAAALVYFVISARRRPGREDPATLGGAPAPDDADSPVGDAPTADTAPATKRTDEVDIDVDTTSTTRSTTDGNSTNTGTRNTGTRNTGTDEAVTRES